MSKKNLLKPLLIALALFSMQRADAQNWFGSTIKTYTLDNAAIGSTPQATDATLFLKSYWNLAQGAPTALRIISGKCTGCLMTDPPPTVSSYLNIMEVYSGIQGFPSPIGDDEPSINSTFPVFILNSDGNTGVRIQPDVTKGPATGSQFAFTAHGASWLDNRTLVGPWTPNFQTGSTQFMLDVNGKGHFSDKVLIGDPNAVNINTLSYSYKLYVESGIITEKIKVASKTDATNWSDYVFNKDYNLKPLREVEAFVKKNGHLPDVPSASEVAKDGIDLAEMDATLLRKVEELTLYVIDLKKENEQLKKAVAKIKK